MEDLSFAVTGKLVAESNTFVLVNSVETCGIQHLRLHQINGKSTTIGSRTKVGILGDPHPELNSSDFLVQRCFFACQKANSLAIDGGVKRHTCRTQHFHKYSHCTDHTAQMTCVLGSRLSCASKIGHPSTRHVSPCASQHTEHQHKFSLTYLSCITVVLSSDPTPVVHASIYPP